MVNRKTLYFTQREDYDEEMFPREITKLFQIKYPIIQGGMVWASGWKLAAAVSNAGGLGLIGAGSMTPDLLRHHIRQTQANTLLPFGVNLPLIYKHAEDHIRVILEEKVPIVFTSAGNPKTHTPILKAQGIKVVHVVSSEKHAIKCETVGVDAIVCEGFEAGGHNGREELTTMVLIPLVRDTVKIPIIAAGGITDGRTTAAAIALGAQGVQIGTRFALTHESSLHINFKNYCLASGSDATQLTLKKVAPVRLLKNAFALEAIRRESQGDTPEQLLSFLGRGRSRIGMFEGNLKEGELEIGQCVARVHKLATAQAVMDDIIHGYKETRSRLCRQSSLTDDDKFHPSQG